MMEINNYHSLFFLLLEALGTAVSSSVCSSGCSANKMCQCCYGNVGRDVTHELMATILDFLTEFLSTVANRTEQ